jgi:CheY-like chemotaxis protein
LNNIFASIHSSLDLALTPGQVQAQKFLRQAQTSAREGAVLVNELRLGGQEPVVVRDGVFPAQDARPHGPVGAAARPPSLEGSERILLVEDDESVRLLIQAVLTYRGYAVTEAADGEEAVKLFREKGPFDLVILDRAMPKLDGPAALERIRVMDPDVQSLGLSGLLPENEPALRAGAGRGFDAQLSKPFDNTEMITLVRRLLDGRAERPKNAGAGHNSKLHPKLH